MLREALVLVINNSAVILGGQEESYSSERNPKTTVNCTRTEVYVGVQYWHFHGASDDYKPWDMEKLDD